MFSTHHELSMAVAAARAVDVLIVDESAAKSLIQAQ